MEYGDGSRRKIEKIVISMRRTANECPAQTTLQFPPRKPNLLRWVSIGKGGFSFEFHKYLPFFISKRKNYAHPLRIPRETRSRVARTPIVTAKIEPVPFSILFQLELDEKTNGRKLVMWHFCFVDISSQATVT